MKKIIHIRSKYYKDTTIGNLYIDGNNVCYTLEDTVRANGIKVLHETAIPDSPNVGYIVKMRYSPSFKRDMLMLVTPGYKNEITRDGVSFKYVYSHGGNNNNDTDGCILVAKNRNENVIQGTFERDLFNIVKSWIDDGEEVRWYIINRPQP